MECESEGFVFSANAPHKVRPPEAPPIAGACGKVSFRDKVVGNSVIAPKEKKDLFATNLMKVDFVDGNPLLPKFTVDNDYFMELCEPWKDALIIKLLGKRIGYPILMTKLKALWKLNQGFDMRDVGHGYFMLKLDSQEDRWKIMSGGPWMIFDHYLIVKTWSPDFVAEVDSIDSTLAWVRFPSLNMVFYDESFLLSIASVLGKPIKVDLNTLNAERGKFARVCIEIDLSKPVVGRFNIRDHWYHVEYESLHLLCGECGHYGPRSRHYNILCLMQRLFCR